MIEKFKVTIPALTGKKERNAYVYLPTDYNSSDERYPVMYMFDGHNLFDDSEATFGRSWRLADYLDYTDTKLIIASVECNHEGNGRLSEYSPVDFVFRDGEFIRGKGKKYMDWLVKSFKPYIDENFRTLPDRSNTAIGGSSMGGLMTLYALAKYGRYFSRGSALSPSLWVNAENTVESLFGSSNFRNGTKIYLDYGSKEFKNHLPQRNAFAEMCALLVQKGVTVTARVVEGGTHCEASWEKQIPYFMPALGFFPQNK